MEKLTTFSNGLRLIQKKIDGMYSATTGVWVGVGSSDEIEENNGISHFIEHMVFKGTDKKSAFDLVDEIDTLGANVNAFTSKECTCFYFKSISNLVENGLSILSQLVFDSIFDKVEMEREKKVVLEEINMVEDMPDDKVFQIFAKSYFRDNPLARPILGSDKNILSFTKKDILKHMEKYYNPKNIVISIAGDIDFDKNIEWVEKYFANKFKYAGNDVFDRAKTFIPTKNFLAESRDIEQSHLLLGFPSIPFGDVDLDTCQIFNSILGGSMSSKLFQSIREKRGLAYTVYSSISTYRTNGVLSIYSAVSPKNVIDTVKIIREEIDNFVKNGITKEEFNKGKQGLKGSLVLAQESTSSIMNVYGKYLLMTGKIFNMDDRLKAIDNITLDEVNAKIKEAFNFDTCASAYIGKEIDVNLTDIFTK